jgi:signal transduction histidine kinase/CheY-like chemotaxis protein
MDPTPSVPAEIQRVYGPTRNKAEFPAASGISECSPLSPRRLGKVRIPIRVKLSLAITFVIWLSILILSLTILARQKDQLYSRTVEMGKVSLNYFATNANIPLLNDDIVRLNRLIKDAASVKGILYAAIVDRKNTIKAHTDSNNIGNTLQVFQNMEEVRKDENVRYFDYTLPSGTQVLNLSRPITFKDKELGTVHIGLSLDFINHLIYRESVSILILSLFIVLFGIAIAFLLGTSFSRPISKLVDATQEIGKGNLHYRITMKRKDEFGDLASAFNYMADELDKKAIANAQLFAERIRAEKEARKLEEQLHQSQKMEAVGQLAGGIAHDFNNSLTLIKVCSQLALQELGEGNPVREKIQKIDEATQRSGDLARQLLTFSRRQAVEMKVLDLNNLLTNLDKMLRRVIGEDIELVNKTAGGLGKVKADPGQIEQVIVNLTVNARDAMPDGGKLVFETANVDLDQEYARGHIQVTPGPYVVLSVRDTGKGMIPEVRQHIFEPFFTTKDAGKGTGLGLFMVYGIVQKHGGHIIVESEPGVGSIFKVYLPQADEQMEAARGELLEKRLPRGGETVLVVEDDKDLRSLMAQALKQQGYKALEAANGEEGLLLFDKYRQEINLVVTDIVMPVMSGFELTDLLMPLCAQMKVLYISGYPDNPALQKRYLNPETNFIPKPFSLEDLAIKVRKVLDN